MSLKVKGLFCRYVVGSNRVLFVLKDGSTAWPIKDFLITQDRCEVVTIEGRCRKGGLPRGGKFITLCFSCFEKVSVLRLLLE